MFGILKLFMVSTNLFVIVNVKQLRTGGSIRILLPFFPNILGCWRPKFSNFLTVFTVGLSLARFWRAFGISGGGGLSTPSLCTPLYEITHAWPCGPAVPDTISNLLAPELFF